MKLWTEKHSWHKKDARKKAEKLDRSQIKKIAVIRHAALGDMLLTRPMLIALKTAFPQAELTLSVVSNYMKGLPEDLVDRIHITKGNDKKYGIKESYNSIKSLGYQDLIFDVAMTSRSYWVTKLNPAALKVGYMQRGIYRLLYDIAIPRANYRFEAEALLEQVNLFGVNHEWPLRFDYPILERAYIKPYIVYFATASEPSKCWPTDNMAELIKRSCQQYPDRDHLLIAGLANWEKDTAKTISDIVGEHPNFSSLNAGKDDFSLVQHADVVVINDTGLRNLGIACYAPTLCFFPVAHNAFRYQPHFGKHQVVMADDNGWASVEKAEQALHMLLSD